MFRHFGAARATHFPLRAPTPCLQKRSTRHPPEVYVSRTLEKAVSLDETRMLHRLNLQFMNTDKLIPLTAAAVIITAGATHAQEWTRFRGPNGTGVSDARTVPAKWTEKDYNWKVKLPGTGHSSPVVWGDRIFLTTTDPDRAGNTLRSHSVKDGSLLWETRIAFAPFRKHKLNSFAASTPCVDKDRVYMTWSTPEKHVAVAFTHGGKRVWERDLGSFASAHGLGASAILFEGKLIVPNDQNEDSHMVALDAKTGKTVWKTARKGSEKTAYSTPCVYAPKGEKASLIFNSFSYGISAMDPDTGEMLWTYEDAFDKRSCSSPVVGGGVIIGSTGSGGGGNFVTAIRPGNRSGKKPELAWRLHEAAPYVPTPVYHEGSFYMISDKGIASCVDAASGSVRWRERVCGRTFGAPILVDGKFYCISTAGEVVVIRASEQFEQIAKNDLDEEIQSTPAIAHGTMFIRTTGHLISLGGKQSL